MEPMLLFGQRLAFARKTKGLTQMELAVALGDRYTQSMISTVEHGNSLLLFEGAAKAAEELGVSLDWLAGLTDDPAPKPARSPLGVGDPRVPWGERPGVVGAPLKLDETTAYVVSGDAMRPTLPDGSTILVNGNRTALRENHIFLYRTGGALYVRRAQRWPHGVWWWCSDSPDDRERRVQYDPEADEIVGEVRWVGHLVSE